MDPPKNRKSTFIVQISSCQNASWQGTVTWADGRETVPFRSALELIKLIDSAVDPAPKKGTKDNL